MAAGDAPGALGARAGAGERTFVAALLAVFAALAILSMRVKNPTFDETAHLAAGVSYVQKRDFRMNPEHPVLPKLLAGASAGLAGAKHSWDTEAWRDAEQWDFAREVLYGPGADWRRILFAGRLPMVAIGVALGFATWAWTRAMAGPTGAAVALALYAFCPNLLAHARLVTTDVPLTLAVVGASACLWAAWRGGRIG
ncbi:MAG: ArnT family glycosyltransferase, partial [bacterium]